MEALQVADVPSHRLSPFVKWAGGKSQLLRQLRRLYPSNFASYHEPFLGGGAAFFDLYRRGKISRAYLNDANRDLMNLWAAVKSKVDGLVGELERLRKDASKSDLYYQRRKEYNSTRLRKDFLANPQVRKAALLIYLNKTCYNGLYRVNASGEFNVPFGRYKNPNLFSLPNLKAVSWALRDEKRIRLSAADFEETSNHASVGDFVYLDPPYHPLSPTSSFTAYTSRGFGFEDQARLSRHFKKMDQRGCYVMLSNSQSRNLLQALYEGYFRRGAFRIVKAPRAISSVGSSRGAIEELVITNYLSSEGRQDTLVQS